VEGQAQAGGSDGETEEGGGEVVALRVGGVGAGLGLEAIAQAVAVHVSEERAGGEAVRAGEGFLAIQEAVGVGVAVGEEAAEVELVEVAEAVAVEVLD